jgi:HK97 family phage portal protein
MSLLDRLLKRSKPVPAKKSVNPYIDSLINKQLARHAGVDVTYTSSMRQADVYTCVKIISESIGMLPLKLYREKDGYLQEVSRGTREYKIVCQTPNDYMTTQEFIEHLVTVLMLRGHAFADIKQNSLGSLMSLEPMRYLDTVNLSMNTDGVPFAKWVTNGGKSMTSYAPFHKDNLFDIKLMSLDGYQGISPIRAMAEQIGTAIATQRHNAKIFENGTRLSGLLTTDDFLDDDAIERISTSWNGAYGGTDNAGKVAILEGGLSYTNITMTNQDAQLLELLGFSREQIAAAYRVPVHMLNDTSAQTMNNVEQNNLQFLKSTLMPVIIKLENGLGKLLPDNMVVKFDTAAFVRGDLKTQSEVAERMIKNRIISHEESREMFDLAPAKEDHTFVIQSNNYVWGNAEQAKAHSEASLEAVRNGVNSANRMRPNQEDPDDKPKPKEGEDD